MNKNQELLRALQISSPEQNDMIQISLDSGAVGPKMTGGGGGGAVIALCPQNEEAVTSALKTAGYETLTPFIEPGTQGNKSSKSTHPITPTKSTDEQLIVVDENDEVLGFMPRSQCHAGEGILHRAFSIHIFNDQNQILLQQRSEQKQLWPLYWSNSCCSHPRVSETTIDAAQRRLREELRISVPLQYLFKFKYQARFANEGAENELCSVYIGRSNGPVIIDESEIASWRFVGIRTLESELNDHPERFTPWFKIQWQQLRRKLDFDAADLGLA
jgi:isopentenyl-diphosphate delta-isomerase